MSRTMRCSIRRSFTRRTHAGLAAGALVLALLLSAGSAFAGASDLPVAGRWDATLVSGTHRVAAWFELSGSAPVPRMKLQPPAGGPENVEMAIWQDGHLMTASAALGAVPLYLVGDRLEGFGRNMAGDTLHVIAVRAPDLPEVPVTWGEPVTLFDGRSLAGWTTRWGRDSAWTVDRGVLTNQHGPGDDLVSLKRYMNFKLHLQYRLFAHQDSGVHLRGRYEIQLTDREDPAGDLGRTGSVYGWYVPLADAQKPAGEWNTLDVELVGPRLTASLNGKLIHDHLKLESITGDALDSDEGQPGPIMLQGYLGSVEFRDIVVTPAK